MNQNDRYEFTEKHVVPLLSVILDFLDEGKLTESEEALNFFYALRNDTLPIDMSILEASHK